MEESRSLCKDLPWLQRGVDKTEGKTWLWTSAPNLINESSACFKESPFCLLSIADLSMSHFLPVTLPWALAPSFTSSLWLPTLSFFFSSSCLQGQGFWQTSLFIQLFQGLTNVKHLTGLYHIWHFLLCLLQPCWKAAQPAGIPPTLSSHRLTAWPPPLSLLSAGDNGHTRMKLRPHRNPWQNFHWPE